MNTKPVDLGFVDIFDNEDYLLGIDFDDYSMGVDGTLRNFPVSRFVTVETLLAMTDAVAAGDVIPVLDVSDTAVSSYGRFKGIDAVQFARVNPVWYDVSYGSGWMGYGGSYYNPNYNRIGNLVTLRGQIKRNSGSGTTMFQLPVGYRPSAKVRLPILTNGGLGTMEIETNGNAKYVVGGVSWISLDGLTFTL